MDLSSEQKPPSWLKKPVTFEDALNHSIYYGSEFEDMVNVEDSSKFSSGIRSFLYWRRQLIPSVTSLSVMFCLIGSKGLMPLNVLNVMVGAMRAFCLEQAVEFSQGANSNFLAISFKSEDDVKYFKEHFKYFGDSVLGFVKPASTESVRYSLLWLPPLFSGEKVRGLFKKYCDDFTTVKGSINVGEGRYMPSSVVRGTLTLKPGVGPEDLPHLIPLPQPHLGYALLIIDGRTPFCLKCLRRGHLRKDCSRPRCRSCHFYHLHEEQCDNTSYAAKVSRSPGAVLSYCWVDDVSIPAEAAALSASEKEDLPVPTSVLLSVDGVVDPLGEEQLEVKGESKSSGISLFTSSETAAENAVETFVDSRNGCDNTSHSACSDADGETIASPGCDSGQVIDEFPDTPKEDVYFKEQFSPDMVLSDVSVLCDDDQEDYQRSCEPDSEGFSDEGDLKKSSSDSGGGGKRQRVIGLPKMNVDIPQDEFDVSKGRDLRSGSRNDGKEKGNASLKRARGTNPPKSYSTKFK